MSRWVWLAKLPSNSSELLYMIIYRIVRSNDAILPKMGEDGWQLISMYEGKMYFSREEKRKKEKNKAIQSEEYLSFRSLYPSKTWIYDDKLIVKYNALVSEGLHSDIMVAVSQYIKEIEVTGQSKICNASTFLNQKRWLQDFRVVKDSNEEWVNKEIKHLPSAKISQILDTKKIWEKEHPTKEFTIWVLRNIIQKYENTRAN